MSVKFRGICAHCNCKSVLCKLLFLKHFRGQLVDHVPLPDYLYFCFWLCFTGLSFVLFGMYQWQNLHFDTKHIMNQVRKKLKQQESIPVGCVQPTSVATTRCQHCTFCTFQAVTFWGVPFGGVPSKGCTFQRVCLLRGVPCGALPSGGCTFWRCIFYGCTFWGCLGCVPALVHPHP